jgi:uncharacterized protein (TIGR03437 family)
MYRFSAIQISLATSALLLCAGLAQAQTPSPSPLSATWTGAPSPVAAGYDLSTSTPASAVTVTITATSATIFDIDPTTVPSWLTLGAMTGTANASPNGATVTFQANSVAAALGVGTYPANVHVAVSGFADLVISVTLTVTDGASTLSVAEAPLGSVTINWIYGSAFPAQTLTVVSSGEPVPFTVTSVNTTVASTVNENIPSNWISLSAASGIAYNFGTPIVVSFLSDVLNNAAVGAELTGNVVIHYGAASPGGTNVTVGLIINVTEPFATVSSIFPAQAPPSASTALTVVVTGTGFGTAPGFSSATSVMITYGGNSAVALTTLTGGTFTVVNPTTMKITIPATNGAQHNPVNILADGATITLQITNGLSNEPSTPETTTLAITSAPIIYSITDAAALVDAPAGTTPSLAPYELVTIFGANFDLSAGSAGAAVASTVDSFGRYPSTLTVPASGSSTLTVSFYSQGAISGATLIANAYLIYVSNTQINALVPSEIIGSIGSVKTTGLQIVITYGSKSNTTTPFLAKPAATNPGIFTIAAEGQGQGAILLPDYSVNSASNLAVKGTTVMIYVSGLGVPTSTAADTAGKSSPKAPGGCISPASYFGAVNKLATPPGTPWTSDDGAVILTSNLADNTLPPCFATAPSVSIGGETATVSYAGWVADSVAGLYQINATVPTKAASGNAIPVVVTAGGVASQTGVTMAIQ